MSCIQITGCQLACSPSAFPTQAFQLNKASTSTSFQLNNASTFTSTYLGTKLPKISLKLTSGTSRYQQPAIVCLFGGKGKSENENEASPWKALEKAVGNFKKDQSIEDLLRQQIQKQEYFDDGGNGGKGPGGGGGSSDGSGEAENEDPSRTWDEFVQVMSATFGIIFLYIYIIRNQEINVLAKDIIRFVFTRQMSFRLRRLTNQWKRVFERMKKKEEYDDPYWLEREILNTPTWYDHPAKYKLIMKSSVDSNVDGDQ